MKRAALFVLLLIASCAQPERSGPFEPGAGGGPGPPGCQAAKERAIEKGEIPPC